MALTRHHQRRSACPLSEDRFGKVRGRLAIVTRAAPGTGAALERETVAKARIQRHVYAVPVLRTLRAEVGFKRAVGLCADRRKTRVHGDGIATPTWQIRMSWRRV